MITGAGDSVALAKSLINMSLDLHKASLERAKSSDDEDGDSDSSSDSPGGGGGVGDGKGGSRRAGAGRMQRNGRAQRE